MQFVKRKKLQKRKYEITRKNLLFYRNNVIITLHLRPIFKERIKTMPSTNDKEQLSVTEEAVPEEAATPETAPNGEKQQKPPKNRKRKALIFLIVLLAAAAVILPLTFVNYDALFQKLTGREETKITYYPADYESDIFQSEEYLSHIGADLTVTVNADGIGAYTYPFTDMESAAEAFGQLEAYNCGAGTLGKYLLALMTGCDSRAEQTAYKELFFPEAQTDLPLSFPPQKIYNIKLIYAGTYDYEGAQHERWKVSLEVVRNDGSALSWLPARDGGEGWFLLREDENGFKIALIAPIGSMN